MSENKKQPIAIQIFLGSSIKNKKVLLEKIKQIKSQEQQALTSKGIP